MALSFDSGAERGVKIVAGSDALLAAQAMARPWFPAEAVTTRDTVRPSSRSRVMAFSAPRTLNELDTWVDSSFRRTAASAACESQGDSTSGVTSRWSAIRSRARWMSARATGIGK